MKKSVNTLNMTYVTIACLIAICIGTLHCAPVDETNLKEPAAFSELTHINSKAASLADSHVMTIEKSDSPKTYRVNEKPSLSDESPNTLKSSSTKQAVPASTTVSTTATLFIK